MPKIDYKSLELASAKLSMNMDTRKDHVASWLGVSNYEQIMKGTGHQDVVDNMVDSQINQVPLGVGLGFKKSSDISSGPEDSVYAKKALHALTKKRPRISERSGEKALEKALEMQDDETESKATVSKKQATASFLDSYKKGKRKR